MIVVVVVVVDIRVDGRCSDRLVGEQRAQPRSGGAAEGDQAAELLVAEEQPGGRVIGERRVGLRIPPQRDVEVGGELRLGVQDRARRPGLRRPGAGLAAGRRVVHAQRRHGALRQGAVDSDQALEAVEVETGDDLGELEAGQLDGLVQRREAPDVVTAGVDADDHRAAPAQQLDEAEVVPVPTVGDEDEAVAVVVPAEDLLEQVAVARLGELGLRVGGEPRVRQPDAEVDVEGGHQRVRRPPRHAAHRRGEGGAGCRHPRGDGTFGPHVVGQPREVALGRRDVTADAHLALRDRERVGGQTAGGDAVALVGAADEQLRRRVRQLVPRHLVALGAASTAGLRRRGARRTSGAGAGGRCCGSTGW